MEPSEVLEKQVELLHRAEAMRARGSAQYNESTRLAERVLRYAETFCLDGAAATLVHQGSETMPTEAILDASVIPARYGFLLSSSAHAFIVDSNTGMHGIRGFLWQHTTAQADGRGGILLLPVCTTGQAFNALTIDYVLQWPYGVSLAESAQRNAELLGERQNLVSAGNGTVLSLFLAFCLFVQQRLLTMPSVRADRPARRRLEHAGWTAEPVIRVILLRRRETNGQHVTEPTDHEWSCQWLVRGHWRQQFYPSKHLNQPIWITPYVKGPEDKPLKPPRATVFAVVR